MSDAMIAAKPGRGKSEPQRLQELLAPLGQRTKIAGPCSAASLADHATAAGSTPATDPNTQDTDRGPHGHTFEDTLSP